MNYLIVTAHPDDEVLGAGATVHKLVAEGHRAAVCVMCNNAAARVNKSDTLADEQKLALEIIGVSKGYFGDFPNIQMNTVPHLELVQFIEKCIIDFEADCIITHHPADINNDHVVTSYAAQAAARIFQRREDVKPVKELWYMEVPSVTDWSLDSSSMPFTPNCFVEIGKEGVSVKLDALSRYKGVMHPYPHPRSRESIEGLAAYRGSQSGCCYAEAFQIAFRRL